MNRFIDAVRKSLATENWYAALYLSLTLPDICARLESEDGKTSRIKFIDWFDRYLAAKYRAEIGTLRHFHVFLSGNDCYALRCAMLHEGGTDITTQQCRETLEHLHFTSFPGIHCNQFNAVLQLEVRVFCEDICNAVGVWFQDFKVDHPDKLPRINDLVVVHSGPHTFSPAM